MDEKARKQLKDKANAAIGQRLAELRKSSNYTQEQFAETLDLAIVHYRNLERGVYGIQPCYLAKLREVYHLDLNYLITGGETPDFDVDVFLTNNSTESKEQFFDRINVYVKKLIKDRDESQQ